MRSGACPALRRNQWPFIPFPCFSRDRSAPGGLSQLLQSFSLTWISDGWVPAVLFVHMPRALVFLIKLLAIGGRDAVAGTVFGSALLGCRSFASLAGHTQVDDFRHQDDTPVQAAIAFAIPL